MSLRNWKLRDHRCAAQKRVSNPEKQLIREREMALSCINELMRKLKRYSNTRDSNLQYVDEVQRLEEQVANFQEGPKAKNERCGIWVYSLSWANANLLAASWNSLSFNPNHS